MLLVGVHGVGDVIEMAVGDEDRVEAFDRLKALGATGVVHATGGAVGDPDPRVQQDVDAAVGGDQKRRLSVVRQACPQAQRHARLLL